MNSLYIILAIPIFAILNGILHYFTQILYHEAYAKHIAIEPESLTQVPLPKIIGQTIANLIGFLIAPLFIWSQLGTQNIGFDLLCGYIIGYLAFLVTRQLFSLIAFMYIKKNPTLVTGKATFKAPAIRMIHTASRVQQFIFISIFAFFVPNPFIIGAACSLAVTTIATYFSKFRNQLFK